MLNGFVDQYTLPYAFIPPSDPNCPLGPGPVGATCGYAYQGANANAAQLAFPGYDQVATSINRQDYSLYLSDKWSPNDRFNAEVGARLDMATYKVPAPGIDPTYLHVALRADDMDAAQPCMGSTRAVWCAVVHVRCQIVVRQLQQRHGETEGSAAADRSVVPNGLEHVGTSDVSPRGAVRADRLVGLWRGRSVALHERLRRLSALQSVLYAPPGTPPSAPTNCGYWGTDAATATPLQVACRTFGEQLYWINQNFGGVAFQPARPATSDNYEFTFSHQFTSGLLNGMAVSVSPWYRNQHDTTASEASPVLQNGVPVVINGQFLFGPQILTNNGREHATGVDFNLTKESAYGLSGQLTMSYINEFSSVIPLSSSEDFYPTIVPASLALGNVYRVGFLSPFQGTVALSYRTHSGWRINPRFTYNIGYPTDNGLLTSAIINGVPVNVPNTNAVAGNAPAGPACFIDPMNPGNVFNPNLVGCRGNAQSASPGGKLSPPDSTTNLTIEYSPPTSRLTYGFDVENLFNETYSGALINSRYEPIATGISGPLTGYSTSGVNYLNNSTYPSAWPQYGSFIKSNGVYVDIPNNVGRSFYFYIQARL